MVRVRPSVRSELILGAHESQNRVQAASKSTYKLCKSTYKVCKSTYKPKGVPEELIWSHFGAALGSFRVTLGPLLACEGVFRTLSEPFRRYFGYMKVGCPKYSFSLQTSMIL